MADVVTAPPATPSHLSWSALSDWIRCGKAFQFSRILGLPEQPGMSRAGGSAVHAATEAYDRQLLIGG